MEKGSVLERNHGTFICEVLQVILGNKPSLTHTGLVKPCLFFSHCYMSIENHQGPLIIVVIEGPRLTELLWKEPYECHLWEKLPPDHHLERHWWGGGKGTQ